MLLHLSLYPSSKVFSYKGSADVRDVLLRLLLHLLRIIGEVVSNSVVLANLIRNLLDGEVLIGWNMYLSDVFAVELLLPAAHNVL